MATWMRWGVGASVVAGAILYWWGYRAEEDFVTALVIIWAVVFFFVRGSRFDTTKRK